MLSKILLFFMLGTFGLHAIEGAVSVSVVEKERHFISEELIVKVDLKSTAFSIKDARVRLENSEDYIVQAPKSAASLETIDINDTDWQIVHYEYKLYPLHAGEIHIPKIDISFSASMGYGQPEKAFNLSSEILQFNVEAPEGIDSHTFVLSTTEYSVINTISMKMKEGNTTQIKVGDAITLSINQKAKNVPDILLRPSTMHESEYFNIYSEEPQLKTEQSYATRIDTYTLVASKEGNVTIPAQHFVWWDTEKRILHKEVTDAYAFEILPNPELPPKSVTLDEKNSKLWLYWLMAILVLLIVFYKLYPHYLTWSKQRKLFYAHSEEGLYANLLVSPDHTTLYQNFYTWLESISPKLAKEGFRGVIEFQPSFEKPLDQFEAVLAKQEQEFDKIAFIDEVKKLREQLLLKQKQQNLVPTINP